MQREFEALCLFVLCPWLTAIAYRLLGADEFIYPFCAIFGLGVTFGFIVVGERRFLEGMALICGAVATFFAIAGFDGRNPLEPLTIPGLIESGVLAIGSALYFAWLGFRAGALILERLGISAYDEVNG